MRDPELVARAQRAAARLEAAWEGWRAMQGLADTPAQPVVGYVGYALKEPWGQPRAVIGFSADEAERLAEHLERGTVTVPPQATPSARSTAPKAAAPKAAKSAVEQWSGSSKGKPDTGGEPEAGQQQPAAEPKAKVAVKRSLPPFSRFSGASKRPVRNQCQIVGCGGDPPLPHNRLGSGRPGPGPSPDSTDAPQEMRAPPGRCSTCSGWPQPGSSSGTPGSPVPSPPGAG
jgi:hypothetical protein